MNNVDLDRAKRVANEIVNLHEGAENMINNAKQGTQMFVDMLEGVEAPKVAQKELETVAFQIVDSLILDWGLENKTLVELKQKEHIDVITARIACLLKNNHIDIVD